MKQIKRAFSLVEVLIVVAILAIAAVVVLPSFLGGSHEADLTSATSQIVASVRESQSQSANQTKSAEWGIHFENATSTAPFYAVFTGTSYASGTIESTYRLPATIGYVTSTLPSGSSVDVTFSPVSGAASAPTTIQIYVLSQPSLSSTISIAASGQVIASTPSTPGLSLNQSQYVYVFDSGNNRVEKFDLSGNALAPQIGCSTGACTPTSTDGKFHFSVPLANALAVNSNGDVYVADFTNNRVEKFDSSGVFLGPQIGCSTGACAPTSTNGMFNGPSAVAVDGSGNVYVVDTNNNRVEKFDSSGNYVSQIGCSSNACAPGSLGGQLNTPYNIAVDGAGNVYITDAGNNRVEKFDSSGNYANLQFGCSSGACTPTSTASGAFNGPTGIALDPLGNLYVVDSGNNRVEKFDSSGNFIAPQIGCTSGACTTGSANKLFLQATGVAVASDGTVYVSDAASNNIQEFDSAGNKLNSQLGCSSSYCSPSASAGAFSAPASVAIH